MQIVKADGIVKTALIALFIMCVGMSVGAQAQRTVSVDEVLALARVNAPDKLRAEALSLQAARWRETGATLFPSRPRLLLDYDTESPFGSKDYQFTVGLTQELSLWGIGARRNDVAASFAKAADAAHASVLARVDLTTRLVFNKAWILSRQVALAERLVQSSTKLVEASRRRLEAGDMSVLERNTIVLEANKQRIQFEKASSDYERALAELEALTGLDLQNVTLGADTLPSMFSPNNVSIDYYLMAPDWVRLDNEIRIAQAQVELARVAQMPNPTIGLTYSQDRLSIEGDEIQYLAGAPASIGLIDAPGRGVGVNLSLTLPITIPGVWSQDLTGIAEREALLLQLQAQQSVLRVELAGKLAKLQMRLERIQRALQIYEESLALISQSDELLNRGYEGGELSVTELLVGRQQLTSLQSGQLDLIGEFRDTEILLLSIGNR